MREPVAERLAAIRARHDEYLRLKAHGLTHHTPREDQHA